MAEAAQTSKEVPKINEKKKRKEKLLLFFPLYFSATKFKISSCF